MNYSLKPQNSNWYMRLFEKFRPGFWITLGDIIYHPSDIDPSEQRHEGTIAHEEVHVAQMKKYGLLPFLFLYAFVPMPFFFAYFRWKFEREAYLVTIMSYPIVYREFVVEGIVSNLWSKYFLTWPKPLMEKWFIAQGIYKK